MPKIFKFTTIFALILTFVGVISAAEPAPKTDSSKSNLIKSHALITDSFSGLEITPISRAIKEWIRITEGDITVLPPKKSDGVFYNKLLRGEGDVAISSLAISYLNESSEKPWDSDCNNTFYILRTTSRDPVVKLLDNVKSSENENENVGILAFTYTGCFLKYIVVVADRIDDEKVLYETMLHELGHMWGLLDNEKGDKSVMNGMYPMSTCITKEDLEDLYEIFDKKDLASKRSGCLPVSNN